MTSRLSIAVLLLAAAGMWRPPYGGATAVAQTANAAEWKASIVNLASLDFATRMNAARLVRRAPAAEAVPTLAEAVRRHEDQFVRYRALVLLTAFNDRGTRDLMVEVLRDRNDRIREVAYKWLEQNPDVRLTRVLLDALQTEQAEFVRPALVAALAALDDDPQVRRALLTETMRGLDIFRSGVIDALGHHHADYAVDALAGIIKLDGPLQDGAILALGRIGGARAREALAAITTAPADVMTTLRAARCLAAGSCAADVQPLRDAATGARSTALVRAAVAALAAIAASGNATATEALVSLGSGAASARDEAALGLGSVALRRPDAMVAWLDAAAASRRAAAIELLKDGFDRLEEDFAEEQFYAATRAAYWKAAEGSPTRAFASELIQKLQF